MKKPVGGFTLIELVVVITIIAILAAFAIPRYTNLQTQARTAQLNGMFGAVRSAAALARANCAVDLAGVSPAPTCTNVAGTVNMDGVFVPMVNQYPAATTAGIVTAAGLVATPGVVAASDRITVTAGNPIVIQITGALAPASCEIRYTAAGAGGSPTMTMTATGC